ncbi:hypothetical protein ACSS6W_006745 [Trichoderma asperelloides]
MQGRGELNSGTLHGAGCPSLFVPSPRFKRSKGTVGLETSNSSLRALCAGSQKGKLHDPSRDLTIRASLLAFWEKRRQGLSLDGSERRRPGKRFREIEDWGRRHKNRAGEAWETPATPV